MSTWVVLVPCPRVDRAPFSFVATAARRHEDGLQAEVQVLNGVPKWGNQIFLASTADRSQSSAAVASVTTVPKDDAESALLELHALVEDALRQQTHGPAGQPPIPLDEFPVLPVFPVEVFPKWLRSYVEAVAEFTQTPVDLAAMLALAVLALSCQRFAYMEMRLGYREPLCLYILVAMESGERKSAVYRAMVAPVYEYEAELRAKWAPDIARLQSERKILEKSLDKAIAEAAGKDGLQIHKATAANIAQELAELHVPAEPVLVIQDSTPEDMIAGLAEQGGCLAALDAEGGLLDTLMGARYSDSGPNLDPLLKAHAGDEIRTGRVSRGRTTISDPVLTMGIAPQPDVLKGMADKPGAKKRGLLARFLYSLPTSKKGTRKQETDPVDLAVGALYNKHVGVLLAAGEPRVPGQPSPRSATHPSPEAYREWLAFSAWLEPQLAKEAVLGGTNGWAEKMAGQVARIAASFHLADSLAVENQRNSLIPLRTMIRAIHVGRTYLLPHALASMRAMGADPAVEDARAILAWIDRNGKQSFTARDVCDDLRNRFPRPDDAKPGLSVLMNHLWIFEVTEQRSGPGRKPSPRYVFNSETPTENTQNTLNTQFPVLSVFSVEGEEEEICDMGPLVASNVDPFDEPF